MAYLVIAYPKIQPDDFDWIQSHRKQHNPRLYSVVKPHFTLVFAINDIAKDSFINEARQKSAGVKPIDFTINAATINRDDSGDFYHEFLVPDIGNSNIIKLHDQLYSGLFAPHLRFDINFVPHMGIGDSGDPLASKRRIDEINARGISISGRVDTLDIIEYVNGTVTTIETIKL